MFEFKKNSVSLGGLSLCVMSDSNKKFSNFVSRARYVLPCFAWLAVTGLTPWLAQAQDPVEEVIYSTTFEGYAEEFTLVGQENWQGEGVGGNGFTTGFIDPAGLEAFIGFAPPFESAGYISLWRPVPFNPIQSGLPVVVFKALVRFEDSSTENGPFDTFRWSIYNQASVRLFSLVFDNNTLKISSLPDDAEAGLQGSGFSFEHNVVYELEIEMDFQANLWSVRMNGDLVIASRQITTIGLPRNLGDIATEWIFSDPQNPGDNFMVFDDYTVIARAFASPVGPTLTPISRLPNGAFLLRLDGSPGATYIIEGSSDLVEWSEVARRQATEGTFELLDSSAIGKDRRYYRAVLVE